MKIEVTDQGALNGTYYTLDEIDRAKKHMFRQKMKAGVWDAPKGKKERYFIIFCMKQGDMCFQRIYSSGEVDSRKEAWEKFLKTVNIPNGKVKTERNSSQGGLGDAWEHVDAFMPRIVIPDEYKDILEHV